jgi:hypothetical protein
LTEALGYGEKRLTSKEAVAALESLGLQKTAAYKALAEDGKLDPLVVDFRAEAVCGAFLPIRAGRAKQERKFRKPSVPTQTVAQDFTSVLRSPGCPKTSTFKFFRGSFNAIQGRKRNNL